MRRLLYIIQAFGYWIAHISWHESENNLPRIPRAWVGQLYLFVYICVSQTFDVLFGT